MIGLTFFHWRTCRVYSGESEPVCSDLGQALTKEIQRVALTVGTGDNVGEQASLVAQTGRNLPAVWATRVRSLGGEDPLQKGMATHSRILAWRIPWTEEPGGLQSTGLRRAGHDWSYLACMHVRHRQWSRLLKIWEATLPLDITCPCAVTALTAAGIVNPDFRSADPKWKEVF